MAASLVSAIVSTVVNVAGGATFSFSAFLTLTATFAALGALSRALIGKPGEIDTMAGVTQNAKQSDASRKIVYGKQRVGGVIAWFETKDSCRNNESSSTRNGLDTSRDADNEYLDMIIVLAPHEIESLEEIYLDERKIWDGTNFIGTDTDEKFGFTFYDGTQTTYDRDAGHDSAWDSGNILKDCAYIYVTMVYDTEFYANGVPNISCVIKGKKIYDPRQGGQSSSNSSTWTYSNNPALILLDYMRDAKYGLGESYDAFDETALIASANDCDGVLLGAVEVVGNFKIGRQYQITLVGGSNFTSIGASSNAVDVIFTATGNGFAIGGAGQARQRTNNYSCDGVVNTANPFKDNIENILSSMVGTLQYANGKFHINSYNYKTEQTDVIDEDMLVAPIQVTTKTSRRTLYNAVKGRFNSDINNFQVTDYPAQESSTYASNDGETIFLDVDLPFTTHDIMAQRVARLTMLKSRLQQTIQITCNLKAMKYKVGDNIKLTYSRFGWSEKVFEINSFRLAPSVEDGLAVEITATENDSQAYVWNTSDQIDFTKGGEVSIYDGTIPAPTNLVLEPYTENKRTYVKASWTASAAQGIVKYKLYYRRNATGYRPVQQETTYHTSNVIEIYEGYQEQEIEVVLHAISESYGTTSAQLTGTVNVAKIPFDNPKNVIRSTVQNPTTSQVSALAEEVGISLENGAEVTYLYVNANGDVLDSLEFVFEKIVLSSIPQKVNNEIVAETFSNVVTNSTFSTSSDWNFGQDTGAFEITGGKLVYDEVPGIEVVYQLLTGLEVGKTYTASVTVSNSTVSPDFLGIVFIDPLNNDYLITTDSLFNANGTHTTEFVAPSDEVYIGITDAAATGSADLDNLTLTRQDEKAEHFVLISLPESVTDTVTWSHSESNATGISDTGVTTTFNYFSTNQLVNGRKSVEIGLTRPSSSSGFSQHTVTVTASWTEDITLGGVTNTQNKSVTIDVTLSARVA